MNILFITQVYPDEKGCKTLRSSSVCHYWTKEWVKQGHNVMVIYCYPNYSYLFHWIAQKCPHFIAQFTNGTITQKSASTTKYQMDGVNILKIPMYKFCPKIRYPQQTIKYIIETTTQVLNKNNFKPELILSHFDNPILEIAGKFKDVYQVPLSFVLHGYAKDIRRLYPNNYRELIDKVDIWGYRSLAIKEDFDINYGKKNKTFICYSGIPDNYIANIENQPTKIEGKICYVGALIKRKYPEKILIGLLPFLKKQKMHLTYIGEGALKKQIYSIAQKHNILKQITLAGHISRDEVQKELANSDYFIMISRHETFGMVYLEAMAHGCITIASKKEGFDGIIENGKNGFLCNAGDSQELFELLKQIESFSKEQKLRIRKNAIETSRHLTESIVAQKYIEDVLYLINKK
jgi:glycosyltransferase involved in cell wall biosynthesis